MTISYPLAIPSNPQTFARRITIGFQVAVARSTSPFTYQQQIQEHDGQLLSAEITTQVLNREQASDWKGFIAALKGGVGTVLVGDTSYQGPYGNAGGTPKVNGTATRGATTIATKGWTNSITNILKRGDWIQIDQRLYMVLQNVNSDGSGNATLDIAPRLREAHTNDTAIVTEAPKGLFRLDSSSQKLLSAEGGYATVGLSLVEAL